MSVASALKDTDPFVDIHELFVLFNHQFFDGALACVAVGWSKRMTLYDFAY